MDLTVDSDVQQDVYTEQDMPAVKRDLQVNLRHTPDLDSRGPESPSVDQVVVGDIPSQVPGFLPRSALLAKLDRAVGRVSVIHPTTGLQGLGATQLAAAYARAKLADGWRLVAWVNGSDTSSLMTGLTAVADATGLIDSDSGPQITDAAQAVRFWLETDGDRCLLVFDDVTDPAELRPFIPVGGAAQVLITCPQQPALSLGDSVPIPALSGADAAEFLDRRTGLADAEGAAAVAAELAGMPLALAHAAAVIAGQRLTYWSYLDRLLTLSAREDLAQDETQPHQYSVAGAVQLSLQTVQASDRTGVCSRLMEIIAVLSAAGVRRELLHVAGRAGVLLGGRRVAPIMVDRALEWLSRRSLLTFSLDGRTVMLHQLVARAVQDNLARRQRMVAVRLAATFVLDTYARAQVGSQDRPAVRGIPQHVKALLDSMAEPSVDDDGELARVLLRLRFIALYHLIELRDSAPQAIAVGEPLTADLERLLGLDHPDTLNARNSLAAAYLAVGRTGDAIPLFEQILAVRQRELGADHPDTLNSQNNLAAAYQDAGRAADAVPLYEANLATRERLAGAEHPSTLSSRGNLAAAYQDAGRAAEAIPLLEQTLADRERVLGTDHPDTRTSRKNLAAAYQDAGRAAEAAQLLKQTSGGRKKLAAAYRDGSRTATVIHPVEQALIARPSQLLADAAEEVLASFRRPPVNPARRTLPTGFRRPPAGHAKQAFPQNFSLPADKSAVHPKLGQNRELPPENPHHDREVVAAIAAGDPTGIAMAYDRYAPALFGYCHWMLGNPVDAAVALQDTFAIVASTSSDLPDASGLRPWLYALARSECRRRRLAMSARHDEKAETANKQPEAADRRVEPKTQQIEVKPESADATVTFRAVRPPSKVVSELADATVTFRAVRPPSMVVSDPADATVTFRAVRPPTFMIPEMLDATMPFRAITPEPHPTTELSHGELGQAELRILIHTILADLNKREREALELNFRHDLYDKDLAIALGVSWSRAHARVSRAHAHFDEALGALRIALTRRDDCPVLAELLVDWDGQLTEEMRDLVVWHIGECQTCADYRRGTLRPAAFSHLLPLAPLPPELREQVLTLCTSSTRDAFTYRRRVVRRAERTWHALLLRAIRQLSWGSIRANPGAAIAIVAVMVWVVAAVGVSLLTFANPHVARADATPPHARTSASSSATAAPPAVTPTTRTAIRTSPAARHSLAASQPAAYVPPPVQPSLSYSPTVSPSAKPSTSASSSPKPSTSASSSPKPSSSATASPSSSPSPTV